MFYFLSDVNVYKTNWCTALYHRYADINAHFLMLKLTFYYCTCMSLLYHYGERLCIAEFAEIIREN